MSDGQEDEMQTSKRSRVGRRLNLFNLGFAALTASTFLGSDPAAGAAHVARPWHIVPRGRRLHRSTPPAQVPRGLFSQHCAVLFNTDTFEADVVTKHRFSLHQNWLRWLGTGRLGGGRLRRRTVVTSMLPSSTCTSNSCSSRRSVCIDLLFFSASDGRLDKRVRIAGRCDVRRWRRPLPTPLCLGRRWVRPPWRSWAALAALSNGQAVPANGQTAATS